MKPYHVYKILGVSCCLMGGVLGNTYHSYSAGIDISIDAPMDIVENVLVNIGVEGERVQKYTDGTQQSYASKEEVIVKETAKGLVLEFTYTNKDSSKTMELEHPFPKLALNQLIQELNTKTNGQGAAYKTDDIYKLVLKRGDDTTHFRSINLDHDVYKAYGGGSGYEISYVGDDARTLFSTFNNITDIESYIPEECEADVAGRGERFMKNIETIHHYVIDSKYGGDGRDWFCGMTGLKKIGNVKYVGDAKYTDFSNLFQGCTQLNDISKFSLPDTAIYVNNMFQGCTSLEDISGFTLPKSVIDAEEMFNGCTSLTKVPNIFHPESEIEDATSMFEGCISITDLGEFRLPKKIGGYYDNGGVPWEGAYRMFADCTALTKVPNIFEYCESMVNGMGMFQGCMSITDLSEFTLPTNITEVSVMFDGCTSLTKVPNAIFANFNNENYVASNDGLNVKWMFRDCTNLKELEEGFTLPKEINDATGMFEDTSIYELPEGFRVLTGNKKIGFLFSDPRETDPETSIYTYIDSYGNEYKYKKIKLPSKVDPSFIEYVSANRSRLPENWWEDTPYVVYYQTHKIIDDQNQIKGELEFLKKQQKENIDKYNPTLQWQYIEWSDEAECVMFQTEGQIDRDLSVAKYIQPILGAMENIGYVDMYYELKGYNSNTTNPIMKNIEKFGTSVKVLSTQSQDTNKLKYDELWTRINGEFDLIELDDNDEFIKEEIIKNWDAKEIHITGYRMRTVDVEVESENATITSDNNVAKVCLNQNWLENNKINPALNFKIDVKSLGLRQLLSCRTIRWLEAEDTIREGQKPIIMENENIDWSNPWWVERDNYFNFSKDDNIPIDKDLKSGIYNVKYSAIEWYLDWKNPTSNDITCTPTSKELQITIDFTPPTGSISKFSNGTYRIEAHDDLGIDKIVLPDQSEITFDGQTNVEYTLDTVKVGEIYTIYDKAGNTAEITYSSEPATSKPTLDVTVSNNYTSGSWINKEWLENNKNNSNVTITVTATDDQNGIKEVTKTVNGGQSELVTNTSTENNKFIGNDVIHIDESTQSGSYKYEYKAENSNGVSSDTKDVIINIDVKPPTGSISKDNDGRYIIEAKDDFSGIDKIVLPNGIEITSDQLVDGKYTLDSVKDEDKCTIYDKAGNTVEVTYLPNTVISKPTLEVKTDGYVENTWTNKNISVSLIAKDEKNVVVSIEKADNSGTKSNLSVNKGSNPNEYLGNNTIDVSKVTESGSYTYTYVAVNDKGERSESQTITVNIDIKPPTFKITENNNSSYTLTATDDASGVAKIVCPDGTVIEGKDIVNGTYDVSAVVEGTYSIYDNAGNTCTYFYIPSSDAVSGTAISLGYNSNWTNQNVKVKVMLQNADGISGIKLPNEDNITALTDIADKVELDGNINFNYIIEEEGDKEHSFIAYRKTRDSGKELSAPAHVRIDKTEPTCAIVERDGKKYLTVTDNLSGVHHIVSPSGEIIPWSSSYAENGMEITENGTYIAYDNASNRDTIVSSSAGGSGEGEGEIVIPPTPIPPIPQIPDEETQPEGNKKPDGKDPEGNKKPDGKDPEGNKKPDGKDPEGNKKPDGKDPEGNKKPDSKDPEGNKKPDGKNPEGNKKPDSKEPEGNKKPDGKNPEGNKKPDSKEPEGNKKPDSKDLEANKKTEGSSSGGIWIEVIKPDGEVINVFIPKDKIYLLENGKSLSGKEIGYPFIDRIYYIGKTRPVIIGFNGEHYHYVKSLYSEGKVEKILVAPTLQLSDSHSSIVSSNDISISPKTGDSISLTIYLVTGSGVLVYRLHKRKKKSLKAK